MNTNVDKIAFIETLKKRIKVWVCEVLDLCESLPENQSTKVIVYQLIKSSTSTGANYRAACRARSSNEFHAKMSIAVEEADESQYWLELISLKAYSSNYELLSKLLKEADELVRIFSKARFNTKKQ